MIEFDSHFLELENRRLFLGIRLEGGGNRQTRRTGRSVLHVHVLAVFTTQVEI